MDASRARGLIKALESQIDGFANRNGFVRVHVHEWLRRWGWKSDGIRVHLKKHSGIIVNFHVSVPPIPGSPCHCDIGTMNLSNLLGDPRGTFRFPNDASQDEKHVADIVNGLPLGIAWLSQYDTPQLCIDHLLTEHTNPNSKAYKHAENFLHDLPIETNERCCLLNLKYDYPNAYMRAIFDVHHRGILPDPP